MTKQRGTYNEIPSANIADRASHCKHCGTKLNYVDSKSLYCSGLCYQRAQGRETPDKMPARKA